MEILPSEYQQLALSRNEKIFTRYFASSENFGMLILKANPIMQANLYMHVLIVEKGIVLFKFVENITDPLLFEANVQTIIKYIYAPSASIISDKLIGNKTIVDSEGKLRFSTNIVYVFPNISEKDIYSLVDNKDVLSFCKSHCVLKEQFSEFRNSLFERVNQCLENSIVTVSRNKLIINNNNSPAIIQRLCPEYATTRVAGPSADNMGAGASEEAIIVTEDDLAVKAYRLDKEQINIVNKMTKGEQLILACAGSGKSVLLIAKCFKAAMANPDKKFLITCYNQNLYSLYSWFIDRAGLRAKNVTCMTFHKLCKYLLKNNGYVVYGNNFDSWVTNAIDKLNKNLIQDRFYGIFIDEIQQFSTEWYKFCYNLLENKDSKEHIFIICGDKTQNLKKQQKHGLAPWNAGENYPNYRGGNKSIRIEKNYRNCIEVNDFINQFVIYSKLYLDRIDNSREIDPDMFLRGKAVYHGIGVEIKKLKRKKGAEEAKQIIDSISYFHDELHIPYDEIAVIMNHTKYQGYINHWGERKYLLEYCLTKELNAKNIPYCKMYSTDSDWAERYGSSGGVKLITFLSVLGLDFRAAIVCGMASLGEYEKTKNVDWDFVKNDQELYESLLENSQENIRKLYVACTRAKEALHIILPESGENSIYMQIIEEAEASYNARNL